MKGAGTRNKQDCACSQEVTWVESSTSGDGKKNATHEDATLKKKTLRTWSGRTGGEKKGPRGRGGVLGSGARNQENHRWHGTGGVKISCRGGKAKVVIKKLKAGYIGGTGETSGHLASQKV